MDLRLTRKDQRSDGIFGELTNSKNEVVAYTLEHAYANADGTYSPKIPVGTYVCKRGQHQLASMKQPFETFEVQNVPNHANILIHMGNWNCDSEGCVLVGEAITDSFKGKMVTNSKNVFAEFMQLQKGCDTFTLVVV
jgi:hypothetical protein